MKGRFKWLVIFVRGLSIVLLFFLTLLVAAILSNLLLRYGVHVQVGDLLILALIASVIAIPSGILAGIILEEYFPPSEPIKTLPDSLFNFLAFPSIVYALIALAFVTGFFNLTAGLLTGSLTLAICIAPLMIQSTRTAIRAVPREMRTAALALGASRWQRIRFIIFPFAISVIVSGIFRAFALGIGLVGPLLLVGSLISGDIRNLSPHNEVGQIPVEVRAAMQYVFSSALGNGKGILILILISVVLNLIAIRISRRYTLRKAVFRVPD